MPKQAITITLTGTTPEHLEQAITDIRVSLEQSKKCGWIQYDIDSYDPPTNIAEEYDGNFFPTSLHNDD